MPIHTIVADITTLPVDAVVNAANPGLLGGGGVDGAIHRAAGPALLAACRVLPQSAPGVRCRVGEARITPGFGLPARYVIHTVGPIWHDGQQGEAKALASCYLEAMTLLRAHDLHSIAFPAISCGVYGYPAELAATTAVTALRDALHADDSVDVTLCSFSQNMQSILLRALSAA